MEPREEIVQEMKTQIEWICDRIGPRPPCSDAERRLAEHLGEEWGRLADRAELEDFTCRPAAYPATLRGPVALFLFSLCLYHLSPIPALLCSTVSGLILVFNLILNVELIDRIFPEKGSSNVFARFEPSGTAEKTVIISCHHDAHHAFPILNRFGARYSLFMSMVVFSNALMLLLSLLGSIFTLIGSQALWNGYQHAAFPILVLLTLTVPIQLYTFLRVISETPVLGANDNLSGVAVCTALGRYLSVPEHRPRRTRVWIASFGCEEIGIRGSKRFIRKHGKEIQGARVLNLDMVGGKGTSLQAVTKEEKNLIPLSKDMVRIVQEVARQEGIPLRAGPIIAFTDAMAFARKGIQATSLMALDEKGIVGTYHSEEDVPAHLDYGIMFDAYRLSVAFLKYMDERTGP